MKLDVRLTERFAATPDAVWESLTDRDGLAEWLMPNDFVPEVGATFTFVPDHPTPWEGDVTCELLELLPPKRMVWSWQTAGMDEPTRVEFELVPERGGTKLIFRHGGAADEPVTQGLEGGWPDRIGRLTAHLERRARLGVKDERVPRRLERRPKQ